MGVISQWIGKAALGPFSRALPAMGDTERAALEAGTVGFEGDLFAGRPDFAVLIGRGPNRLTGAEQHFLDHDVRELCALLDDFAIDSAQDLPENVWAFLRERKFFGMIIPAEFGGLGFGHHAHATVVTRIATVNVAAAVTVMVPNSLGPAELLLHYGTDAQKHHWLPRLATGAALPCFALTSPYAGSDAASIPDIGELTERDHEGKRTRGFLVDFDKRYITLAPVAGVVGLAFRAVDRSKPPDQQELGITCALLPVPTPGLDVGNRHRPMNSSFMNGPVRGKDVFVPMDWVIGGEQYVGQGWRMLMESLAAGRAISLPALGSALQQGALYIGNGYGRIREQFGLPIGRFHAIAALLAEIAAELYATDAARRYTAAALDAGERPSVASAILKLHLTEAGRRAINTGMDILGGKAIIQGPANVLGIAYRNTPIAITVEGANILTRALIVFGQGAIRCHPYVLAAMNAVERRDTDALGKALIGHALHVARNLWRTIKPNFPRGAPRELAKDARLIARLSTRYALTCDLAMGLLGGKLKRMELLSQRLGDVLSHLYLASACIWRYQIERDEIQRQGNGDGTADPMLPFARAAIRRQLKAATSVLCDIYANLPLGARRLLGWLMMRGLWHLAPLRDRQLLALADTLRTNRDVVARLTPDISAPKNGGLLDLMQALELYERLGADEVTAVNKALRQSGSFEAAARAARDPELALAYLHAADKVIQVDDFPWRSPQARAVTVPARDDVVTADVRGQEAD